MSREESQHPDTAPCSQVLTTAEMSSWLPKEPPVPAKDLTPVLAQYPNQTSEHRHRGWWHGAAVRGKINPPGLLIQKQYNKPSFLLPQISFFCSQKPCLPRGEAQGTIRDKGGCPRPHVQHQAGSGAELGFMQCQATGTVWFD